MRSLQHTLGNNLLGAYIDGINYVKSQKELEKRTRSRWMEESVKRMHLSCPAAGDEDPEKLSQKSVGEKEYNRKSLHEAPGNSSDDADSKKELTDDGT